jgi:hypothetical protein
MDYERIRKERRFKILSFDYDEVLELLVVPTYRSMKIKCVALPKEYYVESVFYDPSGRSFNYIIGSEKFPMHTAGMILPICNDEIEYSIIELNQNKDFKVVDGK